METRKERVGDTEPLAVPSEFVEQWKKSRDSSTILLFPLSLHCSGFPGQRTCQRDIEEERKLLSIQRVYERRHPPNQSDDIPPFRKLLCPDPLCPICNRTTAKFREDPFLPGISPCPCNTQETGQDTSLCLVDSLDGLPTYYPAITYDSNRAIDGSSLSVSKLPVLQPHAANLPPPSLAQQDRDQALTDLDSLVSSMEGDTTTYIINSETPSFICSDVLTLLERQIQKRGDFLMSEDKEDKTQSFRNQSQPERQPSVSGELLPSVADHQDSAQSPPFAGTTGRQENFHMHHQQPPRPKVFEDHSQKGSTQLFWGLPSLHCESLGSTVPASGDCPSTCFNQTLHAYSAHKPTVISGQTTLALPQIQLQALSEALLQSPSQQLPSDQFQAQLESPLPVVAPSGSQLCNCGVCFHTPQPQSGTQLLTPSQIGALEYNILQKVQKNIWGLPPVIQKSQEDFCPPAPHFSFVKQACKAHDSSVSILPGDFPLDDELRKKLEHHLRKRLIQHRWGLPDRIVSSLSSMIPLTEISQDTEEKSSRGLACIPVFTHPSSKNLSKVEPKQLERQLCERSSEMPPLEQDVREQGHGSQTGKNARPLSPAKVVPAPDTHTDQERPVDSHSGHHSTTLEASQHRKEALEAHLSKKFDEISKGQIPEIVQSSRHSVKVNVCEHLLSQVKDLVPLERKDSIFSSFPYGKRQKILEDHIKIFHWRMVNGLPQKVQESIEIFNVKEPQTNSYLQIPSSDVLISGADSKIEAPGPLIGPSNTFHEDTMRTANVPVVDNCLSATLPEGKRGQEIVKNSPFYTSLQFAVEDGKLKALSHTNNSGDKAVHRQAGTEPEILDKSEGSSNNTKKFQRKMKNLEHFLMTDKSKELIKAGKHPNFQSQPNNLMTPVTKVNSQKVETTLTTKMSLTRISVPDSVSVELKNNLIDELKLKLEDRKQRQDQEAPADPPPTSDKETIQTLLTHHQGVPSGDTAASQVFHVQSCSRGSSMQQQQPEPWVPSHIIPKCQAKNSPSSAERVNCRASKPGELGGGDASLEKSQLRRKSRLPPDRAKKTLGSKSSPALSQKRQPPSESSFRNQIKQFFQWLSPGTKLKGQEVSLGKGSSLLSLQARGLGKATFSRNTKAQEVTKAVDQVLLEKQGCSRHSVDVTCSRGPPSSCVKAGKTQQEVELKIPTEKPERRSSNDKATYSTVTNNPSSQKATTAAQSNPTRNRCIKDRSRQPQKNMPSQDKAFRQKHPQSVPHKEPGPKPTPTTHKRQLGQLPPAAPVFAEGTVVLQQDRLSTCCAADYTVSNSSFALGRYGYAADGNSPSVKAASATAAAVLAEARGGGRGGPEDSAWRRPEEEGKEALRTRPGFCRWHQHRELKGLAGSKPEIVSVSVSSFLCNLLREAHPPPDFCMKLKKSQVIKDMNHQS
ncbi:PREDICTED: spermatogenesis-associated protein 31D1-like [Dipodomys ordii]|uniref:Spermatogenesis-associated protein 31D1-like n=1 Tax=Dipodomys ordii TaxID=10020 RepID=A0A1S3FC56_DIPOR|nr:PREDICTED: spermatogenesis-associated protein 31D1-like [Dipodomys ordii]